MNVVLIEFDRRAKPFERFRMKKNKLSLDEHKKIGIELNKMRCMAAYYAALIGNTYPLTAEQVKLSNKAVLAIQALRCEMDNVLQHEHPVEFDAHIYYPKVTVVPLS